MSTIATGVFKTVAIKRQAALGTVAPAGAGGSSQYLRRIKSTLDIGKAGYKSVEVLPSQQIRDFRHGIRSVKGQIDAELVQGGYQPFMESICRQVVQAVVTTGAIATVTAAVTTGSNGTFTRSSGSYLTDGFAIGDVVKWTGWATPALLNNNHYFLITALTATVMTVTSLDGTVVVAKASGDSVTCTFPGKKTWVPVTGQTRDYYTIEHWFADIAQSELFTDVVITEMAVKMPASGMATVTFTAMGLNVTTGTAQYFTSPAVVTGNGILASVNGILNINGANVGIVTSFDFTVKGGYTAIGGVVGTNVDPDIIPGVLDVSGTVTVLFQDATFRDAFLNETESILAVALTTANLPNSPFTSFVLPRIKYTRQTKDDGQGALRLTLPFQALEQVNGGAGTVYLDTTLSIQDSSFA